jgi:hypothetical protein
MLSQAVFGLSFAFGLVAWSLVARHLIWSALQTRPRVDALRPLLVLHCFRFMGLSFLVPGVVSPDLPSAFAVPAAVGDFGAMLLALIALSALRSSLGIALVWIFNIWGTADLLYAFVNGGLVGLEPGHLGAAFYIPTVVVPLLLVTHVLVFRILLQQATRDR